MRVSPVAAICLQIALVLAVQGTSSDGKTYPYWKSISLSALSAKDSWSWQLRGACAAYLEEYRRRGFRSRYLVEEQSTALVEAYYRRPTTPENETKWVEGYKTTQAHPTRDLDTSGKSFKKLTSLPAC